jgi:hypothetical protein
MTLKLDSSGENPKKKSARKYKAALGVGSVVSLFGIGSTLAANISLNGGGNVEFGQGVATTAACDEDGFSVTPVTSYDNLYSIFRVDYVLVSGVNVTPEGSGYLLSGSGVVDQDGDSLIEQSDAKEQFPGQYYDGTDWKRTCDNVVLDFKAYTDDIAYINKTVYNYGSTNEASLQRPLGWSQDPYSIDSTYNWAPGFAGIVDITDDGLDFDSNYAVNSFTGDINDSGGFPDDMNWEPVDYLDLSSASFKFWADYKTNAASISKITVQSSKEFPPDYYSASDNLGNPDLVWTYTYP